MSVSSAPFRKAGAGMLAVAFLLYPFLFYLLFDLVGLWGLGALLGVLVLARVVALRGIPLRWRAATAVMVLAVAFSAAYSQNSVMLKLYPVAVNAGLLGLGLYTLYYPPSAIERLVRTLQWPVSTAGASYMRVVTLVWCVFFAANGALAAYTALAAPTSTWMWYNGAISYLLAGTLFGIELIFRGFYKRRVYRVGAGSVEP